MNETKSRHKSGKYTKCVPQHDELSGDLKNLRRNALRACHSWARDVSPGSFAKYLGGDKTRHTENDKAELPRSLDSPRLVWWKTDLCHPSCKAHLQDSSKYSQTPPHLLIPIINPVELYLASTFFNATKSSQNSQEKVIFSSKRLSLDSPQIESWVSCALYKRLRTRDKTFLWSCFLYACCRSATYLYCF